MQTSHLKSSHIIVTTHLGQQYPFLRSVLPPPLTRSFDDEPCAVSAGGCQSGSFDRILCDVPCSGDGTLVKPPQSPDV